MDQVKIINQNKAELIGVIIGDGCIRYKPDINQYYVEITGNQKEEKEYFNHLKKLFLKEFGLKSRIYFRERGIRLRMFSKDFLEFLIRELNLPYNKDKGENIFIPSLILNNKKLFLACLRGITDTDGSLFLAKKSHRLDYPSIEISTTSKKLAFQIKNKLIDYFRIGFRNFKPQEFRRIYRISINGEEMVDRWYKEIGFSNSRNLKRYYKLKSGDGGI